MSGQLIPNRLWLTRNDGLHLFAFGWWLHVFVWTRGQRRNPVYISLKRAGDT